MKYKSVYISGALTNLEASEVDIKKVYEDIGAFCRSHDLIAYVPHLKSDPVTFAHLTPKEVYDMDRAQVFAADVTLAYVGLPSLGVGQELEIAREGGKDIVLWWFAGQKLSRMARGNPAIVAMLEVTSKEDLLEQLLKYFKGN